MRGPDFAEALLADHAAMAAEAPVDLRIQLRYETHEHDSADRMLDAVRRWSVGYVVFNDHTEDAVKTARSAPEVFAMWARKAGITAERLHAIVAGARDRRREVPRRLARLAAAFDEMGVRYGSHDDPDGETRETFARIGASICEFPLGKAAAAVARANGNPVLMGAPNVVRGGSQSGNVAAEALIRAGCCSALVSDYYYPALAEAAFRLADDGILTLAQAWALISDGPSRIMGLSDRGRLSPGARADLVIVDRETRAVEATISAGRLAYLSGGAAERFVASRGMLGLAAE